MTGSSTGSSQPDVESRAPGSTSDHGQTLQRDEILLATVLRGGVLLSASLIAFGTLVHLVRGGTPPSSYRAFSPGAFSLSHLPAMVHGIASLGGRSIIELGLLVLIATPIVRVALSVILFAKERDVTYVVVTVIVLATLLFSLTG